MHRTPRRYSFSLATVGIAFVTLMLLAPAVAQAQADVFYACYVKGSGVVYRVNPPGSPGADAELKDACQKNHTPFSWTDGMNAILIDDLAGGDLSGTYPDPTVAQLQGSPVSATAPTTGQVLIFDGTDWTPQTPAAGFSGDHAALTNVLPDQHHTAYTDPDAVAAMGAKANPNALNHDRYADAEAVTAMGAKANPNALNHDRYTDAEAVAAVGATGVTDHGLLDAPSLLDDDHMQYLLTNGVRTSTGFAAVGATGGIPVTGAGTRLMWYPGKAAFRAGKINGTQWDDVNVGSNSVAMGYFTTASGPQATAMGHVTTANGGNSTAMGNSTTASGASSTAMGLNTIAQGTASTAMGRDTEASGPFSTAMGLRTTASRNQATAMGQDTEASGYGSTAIGDRSIASGQASTAMGQRTTASGYISTAMGQGTTASGHNGATAMGSATLASGDKSTAMGQQTTASGEGSTAMGLRTTASGRRSTAMGNDASTNGNEGAFVYGDNSTTAVMNSLANNTFQVRAAGGTIFYSNAALTAGVSLAAGGGAWASVSDRNLKENFQDHDGEDVLDAIATMPIQSWNYKAQDPSIRHMGPMAQDFSAAFGLGIDDTHINTVDIDGINLLAVQALETRTRELRAEVTAVRAENRDLKAMLAELSAAVQQLEAALAGIQR